jgi:glycosyltransferase involved in cell wall biosynthesis
MFGQPAVPIKIIRSKTSLWKRDKPLLSVIVTCYNHGSVIYDALRSVRNQTLCDFELIIVNDGSTEKETLNILQELKREGLRVLKREKVNRAAALNLGISNARGKYICCLDADDTIEETYFEKCLCLMESNPGISFAYALLRTFGDESQIGNTGPFDLGLLLEYNHVCVAAIFRQSSWEAVQGYDAQMEGYEDWDFWIKLGKAGFRGQLIPEVLFNYRRQGQTFKSRAEKNRRVLLARLRANHYDLHAHTERIEMIKGSYCDYQVTKPFVNLRRKEQYLSERHQGLAIVSRYPSERSDVQNLFIKLGRQFDLLVVITCQSSSTPEKERGWLSKTYPLYGFLEPYCWREFIVNIVETRSIDLVLIYDSLIAYDWLPQIRRSKPVYVVDFLAGAESTCVSKSQEFQRFIDCHIASERTAAAIDNRIGRSLKVLDWHTFAPTG